MNMTIYSSDDGVQSIQESLLAAVADLTQTRADVADLYETALMVNEAHTRFDWAQINHAILVRWSVSGLNHIKKAAWKRLERLRRSADAGGTRETTDGDQER